MGHHRRVIVMLAALTAGTASGAAAFDFPGSSSNGYTVTIGVEGRVGPKWPGSDDFTVTPYPIFDFRPIGTAPRFHAPRDGFGLALFDSGPVQIGVVGELELPRHRGSDPALQGIYDKDLAINAGMFVNLWLTPWLRSRTELKAGILGHSGFIIDESLDIVVPVAQWTFSGGPRLRAVDSNVNAYYFSISPAESIASGLPVYDAKGGLRSVGAGAQARYQWNPQWATNAFVEFERLLGDAEDSPLVAVRGSANQVTVGLGIAYSFDLPR
jgi:outer membrane protein